MPGPDDPEQYRRARSDSAASDGEQPREGGAEVNGGGLRKRKREQPFVQIDNAVVNNDRMSFRALGVLTYLLAKPEGWDVRSEAIARGDGREGREAVRTALRELGTLGHYRLERRRLRPTLDTPKGKIVMGTAISEEPVEQWAADWAANEGKAVLVWEQEDGTFTGDHPLATVHELRTGTGDDLAPDVNPQGGTGNGLLGASSLGATGLGASSPDASQLDASSVDASSPGALVRKTPPDDHKDDHKDDHGQPAPPPAGAAAKSVRAEATDEQKRLAAQYAEIWWDRQPSPPMKRGKSNPFIALRDSIILPAVVAGADEREIAQALVHIGVPVPSFGEWQRVITRVRAGQPLGNGRPAQTQTRHVDDASAAERAARRAQFEGRASDPGQIGSDQ